MSDQGKTVKVVIFGIGGVGRALTALISTGRAYHLSRYGVRFAVVALCDSSGYFAEEGKELSDETMAAASEWKQAGKPFKQHDRGVAGTSHDVMKFIDANTVAIDCSASSTIHELLVEALNKGAGVSLANKKPLTAPLAFWKQMTTPANVQRLKYESTVGAGTPMIACLTRILDSGDAIKTVQGAMSGTLGYLMTGLQEGKPYSQVVQEAFDLGFTEPDPRDDLGGVDVGRKALIVARSLGWDMDMDDVQIEPLFPASMEKLPIPEFLKALPSLDADFTAKAVAADKEGKVLRYVATVQAKQCIVGIKALSKDSPIGRLVGSDNMIEFYTSMYGDKPMVVQGAGAGGDVTAAGVLADMVALIPALAK